MLNIDAGFADELRRSGVSFSAKFLGSIPIEKSVNAMVSELRTQVVTECILHVSGIVGISPPHEINPVVGMMIGDVNITNYNIELNISSKMIKVIKDNRLIHRHPLKFFSFGTQGQKNSITENMFGYIAKNKEETDRRCYVIDTKDVTKLIDVLNAAIVVATTDDNPRASTSNDGFVAPTLPARHLRPPTRTTNTTSQQFEVSNCQNAKASGAAGDDVLQQPWYHGSLSRDDAQKLLNNPGEFLVRRSDHSPGQYILSGLTSDMEHKHLFLLDKHNRVRTKDQQFNTISELIAHHMDLGLAVRSEGKDRETSLNLIQPIFK